MNWTVYAFSKDMKF